MEKLITIGKLSKMTGVSTRSIRHYESLGLLQCSKSPDSNYRLYGKSEIQKLQQVLLLKNMGFSLADVLEITTQDENNKIVGVFEYKLNTLYKEISGLRRKKDILEAVIDVYKNYGLEYVNNFYLLKEVLSMSNRFINTFSKLNLELQVKILKELYRTGTLLPQTLREIGTEAGQLMLNELHMIQVKSLLNGIDRGLEKNIMEILEAEEPELSRDAKQAMFTFNDIVRLPDDTIKKWLLKCSDDELCIALKDCSNYLKNKVFLNMLPERVIKLKNNIERKDSVDLALEFSAVNNLIDILKQMDSSGEISIERFD